MFKHVLIATDGSDLSRKAIYNGIALAKAVGAKATAITVTVPFRVFAINPERISDMEESYSNEMRAMATKCLAEVDGVAAAAGTNCELIHATDEHPYHAIIDAAKKNGCDLIVMASHGRRGISAVVLGSETVKVLTHSDIPVLVYR
jgi:nucleotide-binding universal stress UspA family protein